VPKTAHRKLVLLGHHGRRSLGDDHSDEALEAAASAGSGFFVDVFCDFDFNVCVGHGHKKFTTLEHVIDLAERFNTRLAIYPDYEVGSATVYACIEVILQSLFGHKVKAVIYSADPDVLAHLAGRIETGYLAGMIKYPVTDDQAQEALRLKCKHLVVYDNPKRDNWILLLADLAVKNGIELFINVKDRSERGALLLRHVPQIGIIGDDPETIASNIRRNFHNY